jgi:hypothetical protein
MRLVKLGGKGYRGSWLVMDERNRYLNPLAVVITRKVQKTNTNSVITLPLLIKPRDLMTVVIPLSQHFNLFSVELTNFLFGLNQGVVISYNTWTEPVEVPSIDIEELVSKAIRERGERKFGKKIKAVSKDYSNLGSGY